MPERAFTRSQSYLLPPSYEELVAADHPIRYVAAFVDALPASVWETLGVGDAAPLGAPRYAPRLLLALWLGGFLSGIRTSRGLERACQESLLFRWLSGGQTPDHNTLWRFLDTHRLTLEVLLEQTVLTAAQAGLVEWACQAVDGTKILANTRKEGTLSVAQLEALRERTRAAIAELESPQVGEDERPPPGLPAELQQAEVLLARVEAALAEVQALPADTKVSPSDAEARWMKTRQGSAPAYNAPAVVAALDPHQAGRPGRLILAAQVSTDASDNALLPEMIAAAGLAGQPPPVTVADGGYYSGASLQQCAEAGYRVVVPSSRPVQDQHDPFAKERFAYDAETNTYTCPQGTVLTARGTKAGRGGGRLSVYRADPQVCRRCAALGTCTTDRRHGRSITRSATDAVLQRHHDWMATQEAQRLSRLRKSLIEPVFGLIKDHQDGRRTRVRGLDKVQAEWPLQAVAFNLRTLARVWAGQLATAGTETVRA